MISGYDASIVGKQTITVTYKGKTATFEINVKAKSVTKIEVTSPNKLDYIEGQGLDLSGGKVKVFYDNETSEEISLTDDMISGYDASIVCLLYTSIVGMECNYTPFNWTQVNETETTVALEGGGYADGYDVTIARAIADYLGKELVIKKMSWDGLEPALQAGVIDAVIAGMTDTADRRQRVDFTQPYYESQMVMIVRKDDKLADAKSLKDFSNKKVLGQLNTLYDTVIDQIPNVIHATALEDYPAMVMQLNNELVDGVTAELPVAAGIVATNPDLTYVEFADGKGFDVDLTDTSCLLYTSRCV